MAKIMGFDHVSIIVKDAAASVQFYQDVLGLRLLERPDLGFPGYWLDLLSGQSLHIMQLDNPNLGTKRPPHGGRDYHFALRVDGFTDFITRLRALEVTFTQSASGRNALFFKDLDNNVVELFEVS
ncbi:VOC family protein [Thiomicrorhabdus aquaedulcis]|uniref:VOC family protein n=1 Tax=Thiomicrorhabdus aquaedulcis TaxID=2211106 RepID=UPI0018D51333|nr:VOC family protein [Thiomicrorhabdus aquaedulcis]